MSTHPLWRAGVPAFVQRSTAALWTLTVSAVLLSAPVAAQTPTTVAGKLSGEFGVSPSGAATYRISIQVPPGVAGMEPRLALSYNSQGGNGILGMGWSLEGLSAITRCPKTMATDGVRGSVKHNTEDRFCLDGQRLINVVGAYGAAGSEYRTELESFNKVTANGAAGGAAANGPESFTVKTKAGLTMEYGATADSRIEAQGKSVVRVWALNRMRDVKGNVIDYSYTEDNPNGQYLVSSVNYAGRSVQFTYEDRPDKFTGYESGSKVGQVVRLAGVDVWQDGQTALRYGVTYGLHVAPARSLPSEISMCSNLQPIHCLTKLVLVWSGDSDGTAFESTQLQDVNRFPPSSGWFSTSIHNRVWVTDINGDGLPDLLGANDAGLHWQLNTGNGFGSPQTQAESSLIPTSGWFINNIHNRVWVTDINGDGLSDILGATDSGLRWQLSTGSGFGPPQSQADNAFMPSSGWFTKSIHNRVWVTDINGDGLPDILGATDSGLYWQLNTGSGFAPTQMQANNMFTPSNGWFDSSIHNRVWVVDINGDGLPDILGATNSGLYWQLNTGSGFAAPQSNTSNAFTPASGWFDASIHNRVWVTDINGDGLPDILGATNIGLYWQLNTGNGFAPTQMQANNMFTPSSGWFTTGIHGRVWVTDVNGDGLPDILGATDSGLYWQLNTGSGFAAPQSDANNIFTPASGWFDASIHNRMWVIDVGGDGLPDLFGVTNSGIYWQKNLGLSGVRKLKAITSGGARYEMQHSTLSQGQSSTYVRETSGTYPRVNLQVPQQVVSKVSRSNGSGGMNETEYSYGGLKAEHASAQHPGSGRGMLGFRWMKSKELSTGLETYTEYSQSWPTIGQVLKNETRLAGVGNAGLLKQSTTSYGCYQSAAAVGTAAPGGATTGCGAWAAGKVYFPFLSQSVEDSWDLSGVAMPRLSTSSTYAGYAEQGGAVRQFGDPTQVQVDIEQAGVLKQSKATVNEYHPAKTGGVDWQLGRLKKASVISSQY